MVVPEPSESFAVFAPNLNVISEAAAMLNNCAFVTADASTPNPAA